MRRFLPFLVCLAGVTVASLLPSGAFPDGGGGLPDGADKGIHILMYLLLTWTALPAICQPHSACRQILIVLIGIIAYGVLLELLQPLLTTRHFEWTDILANAVGTLGGYLLWERKLHTPWKSQL